MRMAVAALKGTSQDQVRRLVCAARGAGAERISLWDFSDAGDCFGHLPVDEIKMVSPEGVELPEEYLYTVRLLYEEEMPEAVLFPSGVLGDGIAVRLAYQTRAVCTLRLTGLDPVQEGFRAVRRAYGCHMRAEYVLKAPCVCSLALEMWQPDMDEGRPAIQTFTSRLQAHGWYKGYREVLRNQEEKLTDYPVVLVAGCGVGDRETVEKLERLGQYLKAGVGGTRPVVQNGWLPRERLVGLSGTQIAPQICVAFGVSGCPAFMKGVEKSGKVIAVNRDPGAPIFRYSDVGIVGDCRAVLEELLGLAEAEAVGE